LGDCAGSDLRCSTPTIVNDNCLAPHLGKLLRDAACYDIGGPAGRIGNDELHLSRRIAVGTERESTE
jgi:hypothetical protein